jgi:2-polyprenyl-3-methyl-5-hydroxy-6-metoxy-1,4-benzoquinol methylase
MAKGIGQARRGRGHGDVTGESREAVFVPQRSEAPDAIKLDFLTINQQTYDALAPQYAERMLDDIPGDTLLMAPFFRLLAERFPNIPRLELLDVGCGNGLNLRMMDAMGHQPTGIDLSKRMVELSKRTAPAAKVITGNFLDTNLRGSEYHGVFAKSVIHLFPKSYMSDFLARVRFILKPGGVFYLTTTVESKSSEGFSRKIDYRGSPIRFRSRWTEKELTLALAEYDFNIVKQSHNHDVRHKAWMNFWATKE